MCLDKSPTIILIGFTRAAQLIETKLQLRYRSVQLHEGKILRFK